MQSNTKPTQQTNKLYTNSIIYVESNADTPELTYHWERQVLEHNHALYDIGSCSPSSHQYICTPFDYGCIIELTVSYGNQYQQFKYGPIQFEKQLLNQNSNSNSKSKQSSFQAYHINNDQKEPVIIKIQTGYLDVHTATSKLVTKGKIMQTKGQPSILQIQRKNNGYQLQYYVGKTKTKTGYIELQFKDRLERDKLIYQIMKINGIYIQELHNHNTENPIQSVQSVEQSINRILDYQQPVNRNTILSIGSLEKDAGQLIESEEDQTPPYQLIQDIYDILYTPTASFSLPKKDKNNINDQKNNTRSTDGLTNCHSLADPVESNPQTLKSKNYKTHYNKQKIPQRKTITNMIDIDQLSPNTSSILEDDDTLNINEKITHLASINKQLSEQNEKLKKQNNKLKKTDKNDEKLQQEKVKEIKTMISSMAKRIAYLEGFNYAKDQYLNVEDKNPINTRKSPQKNHQKNIPKKYKLPQYKSFKKSIPTNVHPQIIDNHLTKVTPNHSFKQIKPENLKYPIPRSPNSINYRGIQTQPYPSMGRQQQLQGWYSPKMQQFPNR